MATCKNHSDELIIDLFVSLVGDAVQDLLGIYT